ncbi:alpha-amylase family glycosyl hydrolase, partial [Enterococcus faecium]|uniref:alpha-amylase family glycosyl hydrolase n=1 Tax=Enterococcus faecium TaxID=1352 RepID=UPI002931901D
PNNWGSSFGGSAWEFDDNTGEYYLHIFGKKQPDLNWENSKLRTDIYEMMNFWLEKGVAGFRLDVINMISKDQSFPDGELRPNGWGKGSPYYYNGPKIHDYLNEMHNTVFKDRELITVGEMPRLSIEDAQLYTDPHRNELDMVFHFEHTRLGEGKFGKWSPEKWKLTELKNIFSEWQYGLENEG